MNTFGKNQGDLNNIEHSQKGGSPMHANSHKEKQRKKNERYGGPSSSQSLGIPFRVIEIAQKINKYACYDCTRKNADAASLDQQV